MIYTERVSSTDSDRSLSEEDLRFLSDTIRRMGLEFPARLLLELHRPIRSTLYGGALVCYPLLTLLVGASRAQMLVKVVEEPGYYARFIELLEEVG